MQVARGEDLRDDRRRWIAPGTRDGWGRKADFRRATARRNHGYERRRPDPRRTIRSPTTTQTTSGEERSSTVGQLQESVEPAEAVERAGDKADNANRAGNHASRDRTGRRNDSMASSKAVKRRVSTPSCRTRNDIAIFGGIERFAARMSASTPVRPVPGRAGRSRPSIAASGSRPERYRGRPRRPDRGWCG